MKHQINIVCSNGLWPEFIHSCSLGMVDGAVGVCNKCGADIRFMHGLWADNYIEPELVKEFDIEQYEPYDQESGVTFKRVDAGLLEVESDDSGHGRSSYYTNKDDAIAQAKHFKLTEDDLK